MDTPNELEWIILHLRKNLLYYPLLDTKMKIGKYILVKISHAM